MDVRNVVASPKQRTSVPKETTSTDKDSGAKSEKVSRPSKSNSEKDLLDHQHENGTLKCPPDSPVRRSTTESHQSSEFRDSPFKESGAENSPHAREIQTYGSIFYLCNNIYCCPSLEVKFYQKNGCWHGMTVQMSLSCFMLSAFNASFGCLSLLVYLCSDVGGTESVHSGDIIVETGWGTFDDTHYDTESAWGFDSVSGKVWKLGSYAFYLMLAIGFLGA